MNHLSRHASPRQRGVTLIVMLVMLVVITMSSVAVMRGALNADRVSHNARLQTSANQYAQIGLRFCEAEALKEVVGTNPAGSFIRPGTAGNQWETFGNWHGTPIATTVPASYFAAGASTAAPPTRPQCLAEYQTLADGNLVVVVTARGFSADYSQVGGNTVSGSVVWLQSISAVADAS